MNRRFSLSCILILLSLTLNGQRVFEKMKAELAGITTSEQALKFLQMQKKITGAVREISSLTDSTDVAKKLLLSNTGDLVELRSPNSKKLLLFKILGTKEVTSFRVQYIFLDNKKLSRKKIDSLRAIILKRVYIGDPFDQLAKEYSMDENSKNGGDAGWLEQGTLQVELEDRITSNGPGEIFTVDIPYEKWYYVVRNSHAPRVNKKLTVLFVEVKGR